MESLKMKDHFPMVFACELNPNFEVADASFYSYGEQYDSTTEKQDSAIQHAVLSHDRLVEENAELKVVLTQILDGLEDTEATLEQYPFNRSLSDEIELIKELLAKHK